MIVLWDREDGSTGGTSQMYQLAQKAGDIDIKVVDSTQLLEPPA